jgi:hypothetical protein
MNSLIAMSSALLASRDPTAAAPSVGPGPTRRQLEAPTVSRAHQTLGTKTSGVRRANATRDSEAAGSSCRRQLALCVLRAATRPLMDMPRARHARLESIRVSRVLLRAKRAQQASIRQ